MSEQAKVMLTERELCATIHALGNYLCKLASDHPDYDILVVTREKLRLKLSLMKKDAKQGDVQ